MKYIVTVHDNFKKETNTYWNITRIKTEIKENKEYLILYCGDVEIIIPAVFKHRIKIEIQEEE